MGVRNIFHQLAGFDGHDGLALSHGQLDLQGDGHSAANLGVLVMNLEAGRGDLQVIRIGRDVGKLKASVVAGGDGLAVVGDAIGDDDGGVRDGGAGGIRNGSLDGAAAADGLSRCARGKSTHKYCREREKSPHTIQYRKAQRRPVKGFLRTDP